MANHCTDERVEQVETLTVKPYDLNLIPSTHVVELISKSCLLTVDSHCGMCTYTHTCTPSYQININKLMLNLSTYLHERAQTH